MQKRSFSYLADDLTFDLNTRILGLVPPGLYRGFDAEFDATLNLHLVHTESGLFEVDDSLVLSPATGVIVSKQGVVVKETAQIDVAITGNSGSANPRIDLVVLEHQYQAVQGGTQAVYNVITGIPSVNPVPGPLSNTNKQVIIGELFIPGNAADLSVSGVVWTKRQSPKFADILREIQVATINGSGEIVSTVLNADNYYINYPVVSDDFVEVLAILTTSQKNRYIQFITNQRIKITPGTTIKTIGENPVYIEPGECFTLASVDYAFDDGDTPGFTKWIVLKGGEAKLHQENKFFRRTAFNKGSLLSIASNLISLRKDGNVFDIDNKDGDILHRISIFDTSNTPEGVAGGMIILRFINSVQTTIVHLASSGVGEKSISIPNALDLIINEPTTIFLYENTGEYQIIAIESSAFSSITMAKRLNELVISHLIDVESDIVFNTRDILMWLADDAMNMLLRPTNFDEEVEAKAHNFLGLQSFNQSNIDLAGKGGGAIALGSSNIQQVTIDNDITITDIQDGTKDFVNGTLLFLAFKLVTPTGDSSAITVGSTKFEAIGFNVDKVDIYNDTTLILKRDNDKWTVLLSSSFVLPLISLPTWVELSLTAPWSTHTISEFNIYLSAGKVSIRGKFQDTNIDGIQAWSPVVLLAEKYRPANTLIFPIILNSYNIGALKVEPGGQVSIAHEDVPPESEINLGEISYFADNVAIPT